LKALFLGGTSFTGPHAVRELVEHGHEVTVFHRGTHEPDLPAEVRHVHGDLSSWDEHVDDLRALEPDVVVDMVAYVREDARRALDFAGIARRAVVISSADVYLAFGRVHQSEPGAPVELPLTEDSPLRERVIDPTYDKVGVEEEARSDPGFPVTILRYPAVHGPGDPQHRLYQLIRRMDDGRPAILVQDSMAGWRWMRGYSEDCAHALALAVESEEHAGGTYHVAWRDADTLVGWIGKVAEVVDWPGRVVAVPHADLPDALRFDGYFEQDFVVDSSRIRGELGYAEVVDERTALERTIEWERANPPDEFEVDYAAEDAVLASRG
jgi:nucleoside-diphosphate-sugar epimerase